MKFFMNIIPIILFFSPGVSFSSSPCKKSVLSDFTDHSSSKTPYESQPSHLKKVTKASPDFLIEAINDLTNDKLSYEERKIIYTNLVRMAAQQPSMVLELVQRFSTLIFIKKNAVLYQKRSSSVFRRASP